MGFTFSTKAQKCNSLVSGIWEGVRYFNAKLVQALGSPVKLRKALIDKVEQNAASRQISQVERLGESPSAKALSSATAQTRAPKRKRHAAPPRRTDPSVPWWHGRPPAPPCHPHRCSCYALRPSCELTLTWVTLPSNHYL